MREDYNICCESKSVDTAKLHWQAQIGDYPISVAWSCHRHTCSHQQPRSWPLSARLHSPKGWPSMRQSFFNELLIRPAPWRHKQEFARVAIKKLHLGGFLPFLLGFVEECGLGPISPVLGVMSVEVANVVGGLAIAVPSEILLDRRFGRPVRLGLHDAFVAHHRWLLVLGPAETDKFGESLRRPMDRSVWGRGRGRIAGEGTKHSTEVNAAETMITRDRTLIVLVDINATKQQTIISKHRIANNNML